MEIPPVHDVRGGTGFELYADQKLFFAFGIRLAGGSVPADLSGQEELAGSA